MAQKVASIYAELQLDDAQFARKMAQSQSSFKNLATGIDRQSTQIRNAGRQAGDGIDSVTTAAERARRAAADIEIANTLDADARRAAQSLEDIRRAAADAENEVDSLSDSLGNTEGAASRGGSSAGGSFLDGFKGKLGELGGKGGPIAGALIGVAALGVTAGAALMSAISDGMSQQQALGNVQAKLGVDDDTMARIGTAAGNAYVANFGESVEGNMDSLTAAFDFNLIDSSATSKEMETVIGQAETLNNLLDTETSDSLRAVGSLVNSGLVANVDEAVDVIAAARQNGLNAQGDLVDSISEYSSGWANAGISAGTAMALIDQTMALGADNTDRGADAIREFGRRVSEEGDTIVTTLDDIGLNGEDMFEAFKRGGPDAEAAFDAAFDSIRALEDPTERNRAAMGLLGDTAGDFIDVFTQLDPSKAVADFGAIEGAAGRAASAMGDTPAAKMESARRSIETSTDSIKLALAEAFGPQLGKVADWVSENRGQVIGFFTGLADAGFATLDGILAFTSGTLRALAEMQEGVGGAMGGAMSALGGFASTLGGVIKHIPGMEDTGKSIEKAGDAASWYGDMASGAADKMRGMADTIDSARPGIQNMREDVVNAGTEAANSARMMTALGTAVVEDVPDSKTITVSDNSPETIDRLRALGLTVETTPTGLHVTAETSQAEQILSDYLARERRLTVTVDTVRTAQAERDFRMSGGPGSAPVQGPVAPVFSEYADGGIRALPGQAKIQRGQVVQYAEPETGGEAFIPLSSSKRGRSTAILAEVAAMFGLGVTEMADGGILENAAAQRAIAAAKAPSGIGYEYGKLDCSGYHSSIYNAFTGKDVRFTTDSDFASLGFVEGPDPSGNGYNIGTDGGTGMQGHMAGSVFGVPAESGGSHGTVAYGAPAADENSFSTNTGNREVWHLPRSEWNPPMGDDPASERMGVGVDGASTDLSGSSPRRHGETPGGSGDGQRVFVTNWPGSSSSEPPAEERKPKGQFAATWFADGGVEDHSPQIAQGLRVFGEPETGGEAYIPLGANKRGRSKALLADVARRFGMNVYANGGFGGVGNDDGSGEHIGSWEVVKSAPQGDVPLSTPRKSAGLEVWRSDAYKAVSAGVGLALTAASGFDADGKFVGFDTASNGIPGFDRVLEQLTEIASKPTVVITKAEINDPAGIVQDVVDESGLANLAILQRGI